MTVQFMHVFLACALLATAILAEEWTGHRVIDDILTVSDKTLSIRPGSEIVFQGKGRLIFKGKRLDVRSASFSATEVLRNAPRISVFSAEVDVADTTFTNLVSIEPMRFQQCFFNLSECSATFTGCTFVGCSSIDFSRSTGGVVKDCAFVDCPTAVHLYNSWKCLVVRCFFRGSSQYALRLTKSPLSKAVGNVFSDCTLAVRTQQECNGSLFVRNSYFNIATAIRQAALGTITFTDETFQNVRRVISQKSADEPIFIKCNY